ncbi:uroporphyrinogen-III C-methyltransferase [Cellulosilyticum sp. I15G10I2]|uniref:uroporphyrinogen-III C-methyltransferase n=1 Tax=Cellulosilyticum sp. I15G10I2 TaxID=1892843 RepID=UPI000A4EDA6B|nr:uroporphyrinogen-III C-methyltransferase [Cellulosilyticum sp. I15G10I2]
MKKGKVYLVGAGPGDYKLMTLKGMECIKKADVIVYDRLANVNYLKEAKAGCERIYVGKASSQHTLTQDEINEVIVRKAKEGQIVTRLKGGDPYVFGRGAEEGEYLLENDIPFEVIPGITSAIAGPCYAGIPITHRDFASSFHVITGHLKDDENTELNWEALAGVKGTLVFLMGVANLKNISENLIKEGKSPATPVALISWATRPNQSVVTGTLENIYELALEKEVKPPTLIVIGEVVGLRDKLNFFEQKPLFGKNVIVTRAREQSSALVEKISDMGGNAIELPVIKIQEIEDNHELDECLSSLKAYNYLIFTSQNTVDIFFNRLREKGLDSRGLAHMKICAVGPQTVYSLNKQGIRPDIIPERAIGEALYTSLSQELKREDSILIPKSAIAREYLVENLSKICSVKAIDLYNTVTEAIDKDMILRMLDEDKIDYITFTSSSTVKNFIRGIGREHISKLNRTKLVSIGPITSKTILEYGLTVYKEPEIYTIEGLIECIIND